MSDIEVNITPEIIEVQITGGVGPKGEQGPQGDTGPQGPPGDAEGIETVVHDQSVASAHWVVTHSWPGGYPSVTVVDTTNTVVLAEVVYTNANQIDLYFGSAMSGKAYLN